MDQVDRFSIRPTMMVRMVVRTVRSSLLIPILAGIAGLLFGRLSSWMTGMDILSSYVQKLTPLSTLNTSNITPSPPPPGARSPFDQHGSWMGNTWIPPKGWSTFSALDIMLELCKDECLLWLGKSTARWGSLTMYAIINSTGSKNYNSTTTSQ